jgi:hypothetical protein
VLKEKYFRNLFNRNITCSAVDRCVLVTDIPYFTDDNDEERDERTKYFGKRKIGGGDVPDNTGTLARRRLMVGRIVGPTSAQRSAAYRPYVYADVSAGRRVDVSRSRADHEPTTKGRTYDLSPMSI